MASLVLGVAGSVVGGMIGGPLGAKIGYGLGSMLGGMIDAPSTHVEGQRMGDLSIQLNFNGQPIPKNFGTVKNAGTVFWAPQPKAITEHKHEETQGGKGGPEQTSTTYTYTANFAISLGEGVINGVRRIWANKKLVYDMSSSSSGPVGEIAQYIRIYKGTEEQMPDPLIQQFHGNYTPAFRGIAYVVFENLPIDGQIPQFEFEIIRTPDSVLSGQITTTEYTRISSYSGIQRSIYTNPVNGKIYLIESNTQYTVNPKTDIYIIDPSSLQITNSATIPYCSYINKNGSDNFTNISFNNNGDIVYTQQNSNYWFSIITVNKDTLSYSVVNASDPIPSNPSKILDAFKSYGDNSWYWGDVILRSGSNGNLYNIKKDDSYMSFGYFTNSLSDANFVKHQISTGYSYHTDIFKMDSNNNAWFVSSNSTIGQSYGLYLGYINLGGVSVLDIKLDDAEILNPYSIIYDYTTNKIIVACKKQYGYTKLYKVNLTTKQVETVKIVNYLNGHYFSASIEYDQLNRVIIGQYKNATTNSTGGYLATLDFDTLTITSQLYESNSLYFDSETYHAHNYTYVPAIDSYVYTSTINQINNKFALVVNRGNKYAFGTYPLADVVKELSIDAGLTIDQIDTTELNGMVVKGYSKNSQTSERSVIEPLSYIFNFTGVESGSKIKFVKLNKQPIYTLTEKDIGARFYSQNQNFQNLFKNSRQGDNELPKTVNIIYYDIAKDYEENTQQAKRIIETTINNISIQSPIVLSSDEALQAAERLMYAKWASREKYSFETNYSYIDVEPNDILTLNINGHVYYARILKKDESQGIIKFEAESADITVYTQNGVGSSGATVVQTVSINSDTDLYLLDLPIFDLVDNNIGIYAVVDKTTDNQWRGCQLYKSTSQTGVYTAIDSFNQTSVTGVATSVLANDNGLNQIDWFSTVDVTIKNGTLQSITEADMYSTTNNVALIGNELIQFMNATLIGVKQYRLSGILRTRLQTNGKGHQVNDKFILLNFTNSSIKRINTNDYMLGVERYYKAVTNGNFVSNATVIPFTNNGNGLKPFAVENVIGNRNSNGDLTVEFTKRARGQVIFGQMQDNDIDGDFYEIDIYNGSNVVRTIKTTTLNFTYLASEQVTDFGSTQSNITLKIYKMNNIVGRGIEFVGQF